MRTWLYNDPIFDGPALIGNEVKEVTDDDILRDYWPWWVKKMVEKYGRESPLINRDECISDWVVTNWAWEKK
jgi:hypothetical protein